MTKELVERLKAVAYLKVRPAPASDGVTVIASYFTHQDAALCAEAADALEAREARIADLEAENGRLREGFSRLSKSDRALLESRRASARAARDGK